MGNNVLRRQKEDGSEYFIAPSSEDLEAAIAAQNVEASAPARVHAPLAPPPARVRGPLAAPLPAPIRNAKNYTALLGTLLGGCLPASIAVFNIIRGSSTGLGLFTFGLVVLFVFVLSSALVSGHLGNTPEAATFTKFATMATFVLLWSLFAIQFVALVPSGLAQVSCAVVLLVVIGCLVCLWLHFDR